MTRGEVEPLLTVNQVAKQLNVHINTVKRIDPTELPYYKISARGDRRYKPADVDAYVIRRKVHAG